MNHSETRPEVRLKPSSHQPRKAELNEAVWIDASPEDLIRAAFQPVKVVEDPNS
ncbi:MAG: hypothetical protein OXC26_24950 [Albidovulum sp.]|nr:hypothetical protein [Albidovulum sp.]